MVFPNFFFTLKGWMDHYQAPLLLAKGQFGLVYSAFSDKLKKYVAVKVALTTSEKKRYTIAEYEILRRLSHPHIIQVYEFGEFEGKPYFSMEYASFGNLLEHRNTVETFSRELHRKVSYQLISALNYLHNSGYIHLDVKLENVLIMSIVPFVVILADFGFARTYVTEELTVYDVGSPLYLSPEIIFNTPAYGPEIDIWALGLVLYSLFFKRFPRKGDTRQKDFALRQIQQIRDQGLIWEEKDPPNLIVLLESMLAIDSWNRKTAAELLESNWIAVEKRLQLDLAKIVKVNQEPNPDSPLQSNELVSPTPAAAQGIMKKISESSVEKEDISAPQLVAVEDVEKKESTKEVKRASKTKLFSCVKIGD